MSAEHRRKRSTKLYCAASLFATTLCPVQLWGTHPGQTCDQALGESSLAQLAPQHNLAGWWALVHDETQHPSAPSWARAYLKIDAGQHLRIWTWDSPAQEASLVNQERAQRTWTFGCSNYLDYPLTVGGVNIAPESPRTMLAARCATYSPYLGEGERRELLEVTRSPKGLCYVFELGTVDPLQLHPKSLASPETRRLCVNVAPDGQEIYLAYQGHHLESPEETVTYRRWVPPAPGQGTGSSSLDSTSRFDQAQGTTR